MANQGDGWMIAVLMALIGGSSAWAATGGPDAFGYTYIDSDHTGGPTYVWEDIALTGVALPNSDDDEGFASIDFNGTFNFPFYGGSFDQLMVSSNGYVAFGSLTGSATSGNDFSNTSLPNGIYPLIALAWDDMDLDENGNGEGTIYYQVSGTPGNQQLIIQFERAQLWLSTSLITAQLVLYETGIIELRYERADGGGSGATVGIQAGGSGPSLQYSYNSSSLSPNLLIR